VLGLVLVVGKDSFQRLISLVFPAVASSSTDVVVVAVPVVQEYIGIGLVLLPM